MLFNENLYKFTVKRGKTLLNFIKIFNSINISFTLKAKFPFVRNEEFGEEERSLAPIFLNLDIRWT
jgi:hypothetical protein